MQVIAIAARKGGVGKTTLTTHLAVAAIQDGKRAVIVDLDPQTTASEWADGRGDLPPEVVSAQAPRLPRILDMVRDDVDLVFLDTPPAAGDAGQTAIEAADIVLIPTRIQAGDVAAVLRSYNAAAGQDRPAFVVFNDEAPSRRKSVADETRAVLNKKGIATCPITIHSRIAFGESQDGNRTVLETDPQSVAADEIRQLYAWLTSMLKEQTAKA